MTDPVTYLDLEERPIIVRNDWPSQVLTSPVGPISLARVVLTREALYVFATADVPVIAALFVGPDSVDVRGSFDPPTRPSVVRLLAGPAVSWVPAAHCGCGHELARFRPFTTMRLGAR